MRQIFAFFLTTLLLCLGVNQVWAQATHTVYVLTDHLEDGGQYLIVNTNSAGAAYAMGHNGTTVSTDNVTISSGTEKTDNKLFIDSEDVAATSVWTATASGNRFVLVNGEYYPTAQNYNNAIAFSTTAPTNPWTYSSNRLSASVSNNRTKYLYYYNGFTTNISQQNVYIYQAIQIEMDPTIKVSPTAVGINAEEKHTATANIYITGINLSNDITVSITQGADMFSINKTSVAKDADGVSVTITFKAPEASSYPATFTGSLLLSSEGASSVQVPLTGTSTKRDGKFIYELTNTLTNGEEYLIVNLNTAGRGSALSHNGNEVNSVPVTVLNDGEFSSTYYIDGGVTEAAEMTAGGSNSSRTFSNGDSYLRHTSRDNLAFGTGGSSDTEWTLDNNSLYYQAYFLFIIPYNQYLYFDGSSWGIDYNQQYSVYFYQKREIPVRIVDFNSNGGSEVEAQDVYDTKLATEPEAPTKEDYVFAGWYTDEELTNAYDFKTPVTRDITLYAKWETAWYDLTIGNARAATLYLDFAADIPTESLNGSGALEKVYYITQVDDYEAIAEELNGVIPALTGVVLEGDPGTYRFMRSADQSVLAPTGNMLDGSLETISDPRTNDKTKDDYGKSLFTLTTKTGKLQFMLYSGSTLAANRAFLIYREDQAAGSKMLSIVFNGGATGISAAEDEKVELDGEWYTLQGVRLNGKPTQRGIYICNGKRILVK